MLQQGSQGQDVKQLQEQLKAAGFDPGGADGIFGPNTEAALKAYQQSKGLAADGIYGPLTAGAMTSQPTQTPQSSQTPTVDPYAEARKRAEEQAYSVGVDTSKNPISEDYIRALMGDTGAQQSMQNQMQQSTAGTYNAPSQVQVPINQQIPAAVQSYAAAEGLNPGGLEKILSNFQQSLGSYMQPYEQAIRDLLSNMPTSNKTSDEDLRRLAGEYASTIVNPQRLQVEQGLERLLDQLASGRGQVEADYAGSMDMLNELLQKAEYRGQEDAIKRGGARGGLTEYLQGEYGKPVTQQAAQTTAQRAARLSDLTSQGALAERQAGDLLAQLATQEGQLASQQYDVLNQRGYQEQVSDWARALQASQALAQMAMSGQQFNQSLATQLLPYTNLTEYQRQAMPLEWAQTMGEVPGAPNELVPVRQYATQMGQGNQIDWDEGRREVIVGGSRLPIGMLEQYGGYVQDGTAYLPKSLVHYLLGVS